MHNPTTSPVDAIIPSWTCEKPTAFHANPVAGLKLCQYANLFQVDLLSQTESRGDLGGVCFC